MHFSDLPFLLSFNNCVFSAHLESAYTRLRTIIWTFDSYASIVRHADMRACLLTSVRKNQTAHQRQLPILYAQN